MTGYPNGLHYPQPPRYPDGPVALDSLPRPSWPAPIRWAVFLMYVGAAAGLVTGIVRGLTMSLVESIAYTSPTTGTVHSSKSLLAGLIEGLVVAGFWLWMSRKTGVGQNWARVLSSVFFGFASLQLIGGISGLTRSDYPVAAFVVFLIEWAVGLAVVALLWQRESSQFFALARQAR
jgi:hypothetical protein